MASPTPALFRLAARRSYQTKCAAFWSATIDDEKRRLTRAWARARPNADSEAAPVPAASSWRREIAGMGGLLLFIDLLYRFTISIHNPWVTGISPGDRQLRRSI